MGHALTNRIPPRARQAAYLLTPPAKSKAHKTAEHASPKTKEAHPEAAPVPEPEPLPVTDDEGTKVPASEVASSVQTAVVRACLLCSHLPR